MNSKKLYNILENFDFDLLKNPEFKEDSVREEIVIPIIKGLGYNANIPYQIIRSRNLIHPFVSIGSQKKKIFIIPDYLFEVDKKPAWILDAKAPSESIIKSKNVEQAYSYAIHPEVRARFFSLCNGKEFVLFSVDEMNPLLHFEMQALPLYWESLKGILAPEKVLLKNNLAYLKDLGLHLKRLGFEKFQRLIFPKVPVSNITQLEKGMYTINVGGVTLDENRYVATFDFDLEILKQMIGKIPLEGIEKLLDWGKVGRVSVNFADIVYLLDLDCEIGQQLEENDNEIFLPLKINRILN